MWERRNSRGFMTGLSKYVIGCVALLVCLIASLGESMTLDVMDGKESCVIVSAKKGDTISGNFEVLTPVIRKDFMVVLKGPSGLFYKNEKLGEDYFTLTAPDDGDYYLCFVNKDNTKLGQYKKSSVIENKFKKGIKKLQENGTDDMSAYSSMLSEESYMGDDDLDTWYAMNPGFKTVGFGLWVAEDTKLDGIEGVTDDQKNVALFLTEEAEILVQTLKTLNDHEGHLRSKEEIYHSSVGQTASRLIWYTFIEGVVLLAVSWTQLSYIRRFFETKRIL